MTGPIDRVLPLVRNLKEAAAGKYVCDCPACGDTKRHLSITVGDDDRVLLKCFHGCSFADIVAGLNLKQSDLFRSKAPAGESKYKLGKEKADKPPKVYATIEEGFASAARIVGGTLVGSWRYPDDFIIARFDLAKENPASGKPEKECRPFHAVAGGWVMKDPKGLLPLYHRDDLPAESTIHVLEGEKKTDIARSYGLAATTSSHGAGAANKTDWSPLAGRDIIIICDHDGAGREYAETVAAILTALGCVVRIVDLPGLRDGEDFVEWVAADGPMGDKLPEEIKAALLALADAAPAWTPKVSASTTTVHLIELYRPFPIEVLPEPVRSFVKEAAAAMGCDAAYIALPLLAASAAAIGNCFRIELKKGWTEPSILWCAVVGESGTLKSPALELALRPVRNRQRQAMKDYEKAIADYDAAILKYELDMSAWKKAKGTRDMPVKPSRPVCWRNIVEDTTVEALAALLVPNSRGLLLGKDELSGWMNSFGQYKQGRGGDEAHWLNMHGGRPLVVDRKTSGTIYVPRAAVSIIGGIQPGPLARSMRPEFHENGMLARILMAYPPRKPKRWTEAEIDPAMETTIGELFDRLYSLEPVIGDDGDPHPGILHLSAEAKKLWAKFFDEHADEQVHLHGDEAAAWSKLEGYAARLAMVVHCLRWADADITLAHSGVVDEKSMEAGITLSRWFGYEAKRVYAILSQDDESRDRTELVEHVRRLGGRITARDLSHHSRKYQPVEVAEAALNGLVEAGLGRWEEVQATEKGGRPTRRFALADASP